MDAPARIIIVEDESLCALYMKIQLGKMGFLVDAPIATGEEAVERALAERPDLMLMDINLAGEMNGLEAVRLIRQGFEVRVIFTTGYSDQGLRDLAKALNPVAFLVKPIEVGELKRSILSVLGDPWVAGAPKDAGRLE